MIKKTCLLLFAVLVASGYLQAQTDSLQQLFQATKEPGVKVSLLITMGQQSTETDSSAALNYLNRALELAKEHNLTKERGDANLALGTFHYEHFSYDSAKKYVDASLAAYRESQDKEGVASANLQLSELYEEQDRSAEAIKVLFENLAYYESINDSLEAGKVLNRIANSQNYLGYHDDAILHYTRAMDIFESIGYQRGVAVVLSNMAIIYGEEGDSRKSIKNYLRTIAIYEGLDNEPNLPSAYNNIGNDYTELKMPDSALYYFNKSLALSKTRGDLRSMAFSYFHLNSLYNSIDMPEKGAYYGNKSLELAEKINNHQLRINLSHSLSESYEKLGDYKQALRYHKQYQQLEDSVYNIENSQVIHDMQAKYETEKKEKELVLKQADIDRQQVLLTQEARLRSVLIGGMIIVLLLAGLIYRGERAKTKAYDQLSIQNQEIETKNKLIESALAEKESLLKEIHHRVKNNLQVISSILNMQSRSTASPEMLTAIQEGQSRVKAMALIHQKLYQTEKLSEIDFKEYAEELTDHLSSIFESSTGESIVKTVTSPDIKLDIDMAIPLGLILNELISNAYKYAFEGKTGGAISVELKRVGEDQLQLEVADNGKGLPADFNLEKAKSLGLKLVNILTRQLNGQLTVQSTGGARFSIVIQNMKVSV
ncbi:tetratricopeptide repeat protein [uncultured Imperialibacter sp.]|uniref:tetratricopeptide repeat-containing sensor histidine kinase n=1 Tax=uncultured Imperialibacter sp. TaxID=1672639 RepID=UPI0030D7CB51|tara:strand:+ start:27256 stop:29220 length:1965 start_codon:yes stop_codon:yes gene_type:complete